MPDDSNHDHQYADDFSIVGDALNTIDADFDAAGERHTSALATLSTWTTTRHAVAASFAGESSFVDWAKDYGRSWGRQVIIALVIAAVCNKIWGIPLYQVVDVNLSLSLSWAALYAAALALILAYEIFNGLFRGALESLILLAALALLPFGAILGYMIFSWLGGEEVTSKSFVYQLYVGVFARGYSYLSALINWDIFGVISERKNDVGVTVTTVNAAALATWIGIISGTMAIINYALNWMRRAAA